MQLSHVSVSSRAFETVLLVVLSTWRSGCVRREEGASVREREAHGLFAGTARAPRSPQSGLRCSIAPIPDVEFGRGTRHVAPYRRKRRPAMLAEIELA